jgi:hypothetical protein
MKKKEELTGLPKYVWQLVEGRDEDGSKYANWILVHGSGRILARIATLGSWYCDLLFCLPRKQIGRDEEDYSDLRFIDADSAKAYVEKTLANVNIDRPARRMAVKKKRRTWA